MIKKIVFSMLFVMLLIAIFLSTLGVTQIDLGPKFIAFMKNLARDVEDMKIEIPKIPRIVLDDDVSGILRALSSIVNVLSGIVNVIIMVINFVILLIDYLMMLIRNIGILIGRNIIVVHIGDSFAIA